METKYCIPSSFKSRKVCPNFQLIFGKRTIFDMMGSIAIDAGYRAQIDLGLQFLTKNSATEFMITNLFIGLSYSFFTLFVDEKKTF
jgi:hypothetical protein